MRYVLSCILRALKGSDLSATPAVPVITPWYLAQEVNKHFQTPQKSLIFCTGFHGDPCCHRLSGIFRSSLPVFTGLHLGRDNLWQVWEHLNLESPCPCRTPQALPLKGTVPRSQVTNHPGLPETSVVLKLNIPHSGSSNPSAAFGRWRLRSGTRRFLPSHLVDRDTTWTWPLRSPSVGRANGISNICGRPCRAGRTTPATHTSPSAEPATRPMATGAAVVPVCQVRSRRTTHKLALGPCILVKRGSKEASVCISVTSDSRSPTPCVAWRARGGQNHRESRQIRRKKVTCGIREGTARDNLGSRAWLGLHPSHPVALHCGPGS